MVWIKKIFWKLMSKLRSLRQNKVDPEQLLEERIKEMRKRDPFIYK